MQWLETLRMRLQMLLYRGRESQRLNAELQFHLERQTAENIADGMSPEEARQAAMRTFGNPTVVREQVHETWSVFIYSPGSEPEVVDGDYVVGDRPAEEFSIFLDQIWRLDVYKRLY